MHRHELSLPQQTPLTTQSLRYLVFGDERAHPRVYIQAGLHADETPAFLTMVHLRRRLLELEQQGRLIGRVTLVPVANPIGLSQRVLGEPEGRYDLADGSNFNRAFPDPFDAAMCRLAERERLGVPVDAEAVSTALSEALEEETAPDQTSALRLALMRLAIDADLVLDLHSDLNAVVHLITHRAFGAELLPLAARLGAQRLLLTDSRKPAVFDEAVALPRLRLAERFPGASIRPFAAATLELRGNRDVGHDLASHDAAAIIDHLAERGIVRSEVPPADLSRVEAIASDELTAATAPCPGVIVFRKWVGDEVAAGEAVAEIIDPVDGDPSVLAAPRNGIILSCTGTRFAVRGIAVFRVG